MIRSRVIACGACLPSNIVTNDDLAKQNKTKEVTLWVQFNDESISFPPF